MGQDEQIEAGPMEHLKKRKYKLKNHRTFEVE
jgi:hypothetical protein